MRRAARTDANHAAIRDALRAAGMFVCDTSRLGEGFADLVVANRAGRVWLIEVKTEDGRMEPDEVAFCLRLVGPEYRIVTDAQQAVDIVRSER